MAHLPLARPHRDRAVALEHLDVPEPLVHALHDVFGEHVFAVADELSRARGEMHGSRSDERAAAVCRDRLPERVFEDRQVGIALGVTGGL